MSASETGPRPAMAWIERALAHGHLPTRCHEHQVWLERVRARLSPRLRAALVGCVMSPPTLVLFVENAAAATELRFTLRALQTWLATAGQGACNTISVRILPPRLALRNHAPLSLARDCERKHGELEQLEDDERLDAALRRLETTLSRRAGRHG